MFVLQKVTITNTNFDIGHVNGGTNEIRDLRPICGDCKHSMDSKNIDNMIDFVVKYRLYVG
jgi:hypothetical protein